MDVPADLSKLFDTSLVRLDTTLLKKFNPRKFPVVSSMIDRMGKLSSEAQGLKRTLTTYEKLLDSEDQYLYITWEPGTKPNQSFLIGLLKVGYKNLYLYNRSVRTYKVKPLCILDFYVHTSKQRQGYGHRLFDYMLERENVAAGALAIDKPSESLLAFLSKHYNLKNPIWQTTNYVVYPQFFLIVDSDKDSLNGRDHEQASSPNGRKSDEPDNIVVQFPSENHRGGGVASALQTGSASATAFNVKYGVDSIARATSASVSSAQMAKGRKVTSNEHQHLW